MSFLKKVEALEKANLLGGERKIYQQEYHATHTIPLNKITLRLMIAYPGLMNKSGIKKRRR